MAYADLAAVKARAGALSRAWTANSTPSNADITTFLDDVAAELDAYLTARGLAPPAPGSAAANALRNVNAYGALVMALEATYPEGAGPASASKEIDDARKQYDKAVEAIIAGKHPAVGLLEATTASAPSASSLWSKEPGYGLPLGVPTQPAQYPGQPVEDLNPFLAPQIGRGQSL